MELGKIEHLFGNDAGGHNAQGDTSAEVASSARVVEAPIFEVGREVCVTGTRVFPELLVVFAAGIFVLEEDGERGAGGVSLIHAAYDFRLIGLQTGGGAQGAGLAAGQILGEILHAKRNARKDTVYRNTDSLSVRFSKNAYAKFIAKSVHSLSNNSLNVGKDLATQAVSSISTGLSAPRDATLRAITIR